MVVLPAYCADEITPCCPCLYDSVEGLVEAAYTGIVACVDPTECESLARFVSIGRPVGPGNYIAGWIANTIPAPSANRQMTTPKMVNTIIVRLMEEGYPTPEEVASRIALPNFDRRTHAALHFYDHASVAFRSMMSNLTPVCGKGCERIEFVSHASGVPEASYVSWEFTFRMTASL